MNAPRRRCPGPAVLTLLALLALLLCCPACLVLRDAGGVPVDPQVVATIEPGVTTRAQVLALLGAPTGTHRTDLLAAMVQADGAIGTPEVLVPEVAVWQQVDLRADLLAIPLFVLWAEASFRTRTAMVWFDDQGLVSAASYREDGT